MTATVDASCTVTRNGSGGILLKGTVLTPEGAINDGQVVIGGQGLIECVGRNCFDQEQAVRVFDCSDSAISPGFINTHEHIEFAHIAPLEDIGERVDHRHDWRQGLRGFTRRETWRYRIVERYIQWGELRHLLSGTTSIIGGSMAPGLTRNLDFVDGLEAGLTAPTAYADTFPLDDASGILREGDCNYGPSAVTRQEVSALNSFVAHVAEGIDGAAENEFRCLSDRSFDLSAENERSGRSTDIVLPNVSFVHALALTNRDLDLVASHGAKIVWSPRSNISLYGKTLDITSVLNKGIVVALGTDWLPSGSASLQREIACAAQVAGEHLKKPLPAKSLWKMVTINAAKVAGMDDNIGELSPGKVADIVVFSGAAPDPFAMATNSDQSTVELILRGGKILLADDGIGNLSLSDCERVDIGGRSKRLCLSEELDIPFSRFASEMKKRGIYPAVLPPLPASEPTCIPTR
ncbi:amidohydrolase family protein [Labrenzia sp. DG1229]|uniref:amidohydrolase family protein n=1 Tax=Labrenzia sp. DG1229 TaxID=681847 RepID=UPI0004910A8E|nr:amidohydrolase family protein [Labrenzia sp. DG1229]